MATWMNIPLNIVIVAFMGIVVTVQAMSPVPTHTGDTDALVPEQDDHPVSEECTELWGKIGPSSWGTPSTPKSRDDYAEKCVHNDYKKIPCPVLRALMGSGFLEWLPDTVTPKAGLMAALEDVVGASDAILPVFEGAVLDATDTDNNVKLLDLVEITGGHAASSGIIGAATSGSGEDNAAFNSKQFEKLMYLAEEGQYNPKQWGKAVNMFAAERFLRSKLEPETNLVDKQWKANPFSWTFLGLEYASVFNVFKNANIEGSKEGCLECISKSTVKALWEHARLPEGFKPANGADRVDFGIVNKMIKSMEVTMFPKVNKEMEDAVNDEPDKFGPFNGLAQVICGTDFVDCKWRWSECGPCGIPGLDKMKEEFGYNKVLKTTGAWKTKKEVNKLPSEESLLVPSFN